MESLQQSPFVAAGGGGYAPTNPGFVPAIQAGQQAFQSGLKTFGEGAEELGEAIKQHKQNVQDAAAADTTFNMLVPAVQKAGLKIDPDLIAKFGSSSLSQKKGIIGALSTQFATNLQQQQAQSVIQRNNAEVQDLSAQAGQRTQAANAQLAEDQGLARTFQRLASDPQAQKTLDPSTLAVVKSFAGPDIAPRVQAQVMRTLLPALVGGGGKQPFFKATDLGTEIPGVPGAIRVPTGPNTSEIRMKDGTAVQTLQDEDGNPIGYGVQNAKGGLTIKWNKGTGAADGTDPGDGPKLSKDGKFYLKGNTWEPVPGVGATGRMGGRLAGLMGGSDDSAASPAAGAGAGGAMALPLTNGKPDASLLKAGQVYQTARGPATWDGKQFTQ